MNYHSYYYYYGYHLYKMIVGKEVIFHKQYKFGKNSERINGFWKDMLFMLVIYDDVDQLVNITKEYDVYYEKHTNGGFMIYYDNEESVSELKTIFTLIGATIV